MCVRGGGGSLGHFFGELSTLALCGFWYFFGILANLGRPVEGQILKFMKNRYEIRIQHAKNVGNSHLWVF